ncbi:MAG: hypothetical protein LUF30_11440, partial [Lachnospiraceae bacterium]|nr:hypothetical protein [Lachnospiraceae bacterium]
YPGAEFPEASGMFGDDGGMASAAGAASAWMTESMKNASLENASEKTGCVAAQLYTSELLLLDGSAKKTDEDRAPGTGSDAAGNSTDASGDSVDLRREEARMIGRRLRELVGSMPVLDKESGAFRPARYGDIVILLRTVSGWAEVFGEVLADMGIPCFTGSQKGYFSAAEVRVVLSYLQILDNPQQDIPLAAVLRSAIGRFTDEELARIRLVGSLESAGGAKATPVGTAHPEESAARKDTPEVKKEARKLSFYDCCRRYMDSGRNETFDQMDVSKTMHADDPAEAVCADLQAEHQPQISSENDGILKKLRDFFAVYEALRVKSGHTPVHQLLWELLDVTGYGEYAAALPAGRQRKANLDMLVEKAIAYEATSYRGLYHFVRYIENLQKYEVDYGEANIGSEADDTVRIMSIHKSKGLEFPIEAVSGRGKRVNESDVRGKVVMHPDWGIASDYVARLSAEGNAAHAAEFTARSDAPAEEIPARTVRMENTVQNDTSAETLTDDQYPRIRQTTLLKKAIQQRLKNENLGEELRVLYVAMTRAKEKLILTGASRQSRSDFINVNAAHTLDYSVLAGASTYLDWVLPALLGQSDETYFDIHICTPDGNSREEKAGRMSDLFTLGELLRVNPDVCQDEETRGYLERVFASGYPYESSLTIPGKLTVSELKKASQTMEETDSRELYPAETVVPLVPRCVARSREEAAQSEPLTERDIDDGLQPQADGGNIDGRLQPQADGGSIDDRLRSMADGGNIDGRLQSMADGGDSIDGGLPDLAGGRINGEPRPAGSGAARGTIYHTFMENFDFSRKEELRFQLEELINCGKMKRDEAGLIRLGDVSAFLRSEIGQRMARADLEGKLFREQPFVLGVPAKDIYQDPTLEDTILVQGIIDAWFIEGETAQPMEFAARKDAPEDAARAADAAPASQTQRMEFAAGGDAPEEAITIVDYKTDRVQSGEDLVRRYRTQIDYYTKALEQLTGRKVRSRVIYSFHLREAIVL